MLCIWFNTDGCQTCLIERANIGSGSSSRNAEAKFQLFGDIHL